MQLYGISLMHPYKQSGRWQDVFDPDIDQAAYIDAWKKYRTTACTSLPEDEYLDVRNT